MKKTSIKIVSFITAVALAAGFGNLFFAAEESENKNEVSLKISAACENHFFDSFANRPACVNENGNLHICENNFPDEIFREYVSGLVGAEDDYFTEDEITDIHTVNVEADGVSDLRGIEYFTALTLLNCASNQISELDVSNNTELITLYCNQNNLTALDISKNLALKTLDCFLNQLKELTLGENHALTSLDCHYNSLTELDLSSLSSLNLAQCYGNRLTKLNISSNSALRNLRCEDNQLTELDAGNNTSLAYLRCERNKLTKIDVSGNTSLEGLFCNNNMLTELDISKNTALINLDCRDNQLKELNVKNNPELTLIDCSDNLLTELNTNNNVVLRDLFCSDNLITHLNLKNNVQLSSLDCSMNRLTELDLSDNRSLISTTLSPQNNITVNAYKHNGLWLIDINDLVSSKNLDKIMIESPNSDYNPTTGIAYFMERPSSFTYSYDTGLSIRDMTVTVRLIRDEEHDYGTLIPEIPAKCEQEGQKAHYECSICHKFFDENRKEISASDLIIPALTHTVKEEWKFNDNYHWRVCSNDGCDEIFDISPHEGGNATCSEKAICSICKTEYGEFKPDNHINTEIIGAVAATEEKDGYTGDIWCKDCNKKIEEGKIIAKLEHAHDMVKTEARAATHEEDGNIEYFTCLKCGGLFRDETGINKITPEVTIIKATGHTYKEEYKYDENCHWQECDCGKRTKTEAHVFGDWTTIEAADAENEIRERKCEICSYEQTATFPAADYEENKDNNQSTLENQNPQENDKPSKPANTDDSSVSFFTTLFVLNGVVGSVLTIVFLITINDKKRKDCK